jgi:hypothetical protein
MPDPTIRRLPDDHPTARLLDAALTRRMAAGCTGLAATWCPVHGDCACPRADELQGHLAGPLNAPACPLHGIAAKHPLIPGRTVSDDE